LGFNPILGRNNPVSGVGCTSSDGTNLSLNLTTAESGLVEITNISITPGHSHCNFRWSDHPE
jgi:hypothetical protein